MIAFLGRYCRVVVEKTIALEADMLNKYLPVIERANHIIGMSVTVLLIVVPPLYYWLAWLEVVTWPAVNVMLTDGTVHNASVYMGAILSLIGIVICALVPGSKRVLKLEQTHRDFHVAMNDVENAYKCAHVEDSKGAFKLPGEFEGVRERFEFLKSQSDLQDLEPEILLLAAQMSYQTRAVAKTFNTESVARAEDFLKQRRYELERGEAQIALALTVLGRVKSEAKALALDEQVQDSQISRIVAEIAEELAPLGFQVTPRQNTVVEFTMATPAE
jgi:hypothetical protein